MGGEEESKKVEEVEAPSAPAAPAAEEPPALSPVETPKDVAEEKSVIPRAPSDEKVDDSKALAVVEKVPDSEGGSINRDAILTRVETEKRMSLIKAWEESEKTKAENKKELVHIVSFNWAYKKQSSIGAWENTKKANVEAQLRTMEEQLEKKKAEYAEKMKNKIALIHREAEEKRAMVEAKRGEEILKAEEIAAKYRATGATPKKIFGCFGP